MVQRSTDFVRDLIRARHDIVRPHRTLGDLLEEPHVILPCVADTAPRIHFPGQQRNMNQRVALDGDIK